MWHRNVCITIWVRAAEFVFDSFMGLSVRVIFFVIDRFVSLSFVAKISGMFSSGWRPAHILPYGALSRGCQKHLCLVSWGMPFPFAVMRKQYKRSPRGGDIFHRMQKLFLQKQIVYTNLFYQL